MRNEIKLTRTERLLLSNQFQILAKLYPSDRKDFEQQRKIVESGYVYLYPNVFHSIDPEVTLEKSEYVLSVLDMFSAIKTARERLPKKDRPPKKLGTFDGFDANGESDEYLFALFFTSALDRYRDLTDKGKRPIPNSHYPTRHTYEPMLEAWKTSAKTHDLTKADLDRIFDAAKPRV